VREEYEAGDVLQRLRLSIRLEPLLANERTHPADVVLPVACRRHDLAKAAHGVNPARLRSFLFWQTTDCFMTSVTYLIFRLDRRF
jgi:hypothetical protein